MSGTIETVNAYGTGTLRDLVTGELKEYLILNKEFSNENADKFGLTVGDVISFLAIHDEGKGFGNIIRILYSIY